MSVAPWHLEGTPDDREDCVSEFHEEGAYRMLLDAMEQRTLTDPTTHYSNGQPIGFWCSVCMWPLTLAHPTCKCVRPTPEVVPEEEAAVVFGGLEPDGEDLDLHLPDGEEF